MSARARGQRVTRLPTAQKGAQRQVHVLNKRAGISSLRRHRRFFRHTPPVPMKLKKLQALARTART